jgi:hypothetical protein
MRIGKGMKVGGINTARLVLVGDVRGVRTTIQLWLLSIGALLGVPPTTAVAEDARSARSVGATLQRAYPDLIADIEYGGAGEPSVLLWRDGTRMPFAAYPLPVTNAQRPTEDWLAHPEIGDMLRFAYPTGNPTTPPTTDPGRARPSEFFHKMYGDCTKAETRQHLVDVVWLPTKSGQKLKATRINGVAARLQAISIALDALAPRFDVFLKPSAGTYACRPIAGTTSPSAHGFGIAIDIAIGQAHYWRWSKGGIAAYRNAIPMEIVRIFEAHGFIWGGKWQHYDTMHFEYRPELLPPTAELPK